MANHVYFSISFYELNEEGKNKLQTLLDRIKRDDHEYSREGQFYQMMLGETFTNKETGKEFVLTNEVMENEWHMSSELVGPKWCHLEDWDTDYITGYSAWGPPDTGLDWLCEELAKVDPNLIVSMNYTDEAMLFQGFQVYDGADCVEHTEFDNEDLMALFFRNNNEGITEDDYDKETGEWSSEEKEEAYDYMFREVCDDWFSAAESDEIENVRNSRKEN